MGTLFQRGTTIKVRTDFGPENRSAGSKKPGHGWQGAAVERQTLGSASNRRISTCAQAGVAAVPCALNSKSFHGNTLPEGYDN